MRHGVAAHCPVSDIGTAKADPAAGPLAFVPHVF
jgi:hypothetical protein